MRLILAGVGAILLLDAFVSTLIPLLLAARGRAPDFLELTLYGVASVVLVVLKTAGGATGAVLLFRSRQSGRAVAAAVLAYNLAFTLVLGIQSGWTRPATLGTVALNLALLVVVGLPAAGRACEARRPTSRPYASRPLGPRSTGPRRLASCLTYFLTTMTRTAKTREGGRVPPDHV